MAVARGGGRNWCYNLRDDFSDGERLSPCKGISLQKRNEFVHGESGIADQFANSPGGDGIVAVDWHRKVEPTTRPRHDVVATVHADHCKTSAGESRDGLLARNIG